MHDLQSAGQGFVIVHSGWFERSECPNTASLAAELALLTVPSFQTILLKAPWQAVDWRHTDGWPIDRSLPADGVRLPHRKCTLHRFLDVRTWVKERRAVGQNAENQGCFSTLITFDTSYIRRRYSTVD